MGAERFRQFWAEVVGSNGPTVVHPDDFAIEAGQEVQHIEPQAEAAVDRDSAADAVGAAPEGSTTVPADAPVGTSSGDANQSPESEEPPRDPWQTRFPLVTIVVSPQGLIVRGKGWQQFQATGWFWDGSQKDVTDSAKWFTSDPGIARVGEPGRVFFTGKRGSVMVNVSHKQTAQICGTAVGVFPPQPQPPSQPDNPGPAYTQGELDVSNAGSPVEGSGESSAAGSVSESGDEVSGSGGPQ